MSANASEAVVWAAFKIASELAFIAVLCFVVGLSGVYCLACVLQQGFESSRRKRALETLEVTEPAGVSDSED